MVVRAMVRSRLLISEDVCCSSLANLRYLIRVSSLRIAIVQIIIRSKVLWCPEEFCFASPEISKISDSPIFSQDQRRSSEALFPVPSWDSSRGGAAMSMNDGTPEGQRSRRGRFRQLGQAMSQRMNRVRGLFSRTSSNEGGA